MTQFIEFLMGNLFYVIIVVGFVLSLLRKSKAGHRTPDLGGDRVPAGARTEQTEPRRVSVERSRPQRVESVLAPPRSNNDNLEREQHMKVLMEQRKRTETAAKRSSSAAAVPSSRGLAFPGEGAAGAEELRAAVLWAEVLGPPRAKRPFR